MGLAALGPGFGFLHGFGKYPYPWVWQNFSGTCSEAKVRGGLAGVPWGGCVLYVGVGLWGGGCDGGHVCEGWFMASYWAVVPHRAL